MLRHKIRKVKSGNHSRFLNCVESVGRDKDWSLTSASSIIPEVANDKPFPPKCDLRDDWWIVGDQGETGACVGFATADGLLRWHFVKNGLVKQDQLLSARFIWMANKETDENIEYPTTFIESAGTQTKTGLAVARKFGCVLEEDLPFAGNHLFQGSVQEFYLKASRLRINSYINLQTENATIELDALRRWISSQGPVLARLNVDTPFKDAQPSSPKLTFSDGENYGGHAVTLVGYDAKSFIIRNSWGTDWGENGFAFASNEYVQSRFTEAYGVIVEKINN
jgi:C1A family cysteine protease